MFKKRVVHGNGFGGQGLGFPTANFDISEEELNLSTGVYAVKVNDGKLSYKGAMVILKNPWKVEVHLIDFVDKNLYGKELEVNPLQKVSEIEPHNTLQDLKNKIQADINLVNSFFLQLE